MGNHRDLIEPGKIVRMLVCVYLGYPSSMPFLAIASTLRKKDLMALPVLGIGTGICMWRIGLGEYIFVYIVLGNYVLVLRTRNMRPCHGPIRRQQSAAGATGCR